MSEHILKMSNRKSLEITGVSNVTTFDENEVILETSMGNMSILGDDLHITLLNLDEGKIAIDGNVSGVTYKAQSENMKVKSKNLLSRLLK